MDETRNNKVFSENLKHFMELKGVTQKEVAAYCGVSTGTFCDWIKGRVHPRMGKVQKLAEFFNVEKSDLIEERSYDSPYFLNKEAQLMLEEIKRDAQVLEIFREIKILSPENREIVISLIRNLNKGGK